MNCLRHAAESILDLWGSGMVYKKNQVTECSFTSEQMRLKAAE